MIFWLDKLIFGGGHGLGIPHCDARFYWLNDSTHTKKSGQLYTFSHGLGAQLHSFQWTRPPAGESRQLSGRCFRAFQSHRRWFRVEVSWAMRLPDDLDAAHAEIRNFEKQLGNSW